MQHEADLSEHFAFVLSDRDEAEALLWTQFVLRVSRFCFVEET